LFKQDICWPFDFARDNAGSNIAARMAMIAITTKSSINVNPACRVFLVIACSASLFCA